MNGTYAKNWKKLRAYAKSPVYRSSETVTATRSKTLRVKGAFFSDPVLFLLILLSACLLVVGYIRYRILFLVHPDVGGIESNVIYAIQRYMAGYPLYANPEMAPYSITQYSPLYYRIVAACGYVAQLTPDDVLGVYRTSRVVSLIANVVYAVLLFTLSRQFHLTVKISLIVAMAAFVLIPPQAYSRPDSVYNALVIATLYAGLRAIRAIQSGRENRWLALTIGLAALAVATKQTGLVLLLIVPGYYALFRGQWPKAIGIGIATMLVALVFLVGLMPEHNPTILYANVIKGVNQGVDWASFKNNIIDHYLRPFSLYNSIGLPLSIWLMLRAGPAHRWLGWSVLVLFAFALLSSMKWGSALNYFTEYVALTGLVVAVWIQQNQQAMHEWGKTAGGQLVAVCVVGWAVLPSMVNFDWAIALREDALSETPYNQQKQIADYLTNTLHLKPTDAVFVTNHNYCYLNGLLYRNCLIPQQDMVAAVMYPRRKMNYARFEEQIHRGEIRFLVTRTDETTTLFPGLTTDEYQRRKRFPGFDVYEHR